MVKTNAFRIVLFYYTHNKKPVCVTDVYPVKYSSGRTARICDHEPILQNQLFSNKSRESHFLI